MAKEISYHDNSSERKPHNDSWRSLSKAKQCHEQEDRKTLTECSSKGTSAQKRQETPHKNKSGFGWGAWVFCDKRMHCKNENPFPKHTSVNGEKNSVTVIIRLNQNQKLTVDEAFQRLSNGMNKRLATNHLDVPSLNDVIRCDKMWKSFESITYRNKDLQWYRACTLAAQRPNREIFRRRNEQNKHPSYSSKRCIRFRTQ